MTKNLPSIVSSSIVLFGIWLSLTLTFDLQEIILGVVVSVLTAVAVKAHLPGIFFAF